MSWNDIRLYCFLMCMGFVIFVFYQLLGRNNSIDENTIDCAGGYHQAMLGDEIAELLELPIVKVGSVPDTVQNEPQIRLAVDYPLESAVCGLEIMYLSQYDNSIQISIKVFDASGSPTDWLCLDFEEENNSGLGSFRSVCSRTLELEEKNVFLRIYSQEASDITRQFANNLELLSN